MIRLLDDRQREIQLLRPPRTIVSLVPSDTYSLAALGVADRLVGRTDYCFAPAEVAAKVTSIGSSMVSSIGSSVTTQVCPIRA